MNIKSLLFKDKVLIFAILFSAVWHLFWLSAFTIVVVPQAAKPVKFSTVSFLGSILDRGVLKVDVKPRERTTLEKQYISYIEVLPMQGKGTFSWDDYVLPGIGAGIDFGGDGEFTGLTVSGIDYPKTEPGRDID